MLFNGGVVKSEVLRNRLLETLNAWLVADGASPARVLPGEDPDLAVARGAAYFGRVRAGKGLRIRGGTARGYYVGIEARCPPCRAWSRPSSRSASRRSGSKKAARHPLPPQELGVVVGEPVTFRFFGSSVRRADEAGTVLERWTPGEIEELAPIEVTLPAEGRPTGDVVPIRLRAQVTPIGTLELEAIRSSH